MLNRRIAFHHPLLAIAFEGSINLVEIEQRETEKAYGEAQANLETKAKYLQKQGIDPTADRNTLIGLIPNANATNKKVINDILDIRTAIAAYERKLGVQR